MLGLSPSGSITRLVVGPVTVSVIVHVQLFSSALSRGAEAPRRNILNLSFRKGK